MKQIRGISGLDQKSILMKSDHNSLQISFFVNKIRIICGFRKMTNYLPVAIPFMSISIMIPNASS